MNSFERPIDGVVLRSAIIAGAGVVAVALSPRSATVGPVVGGSSPAAVAAEHNAAIRPFRLNVPVDDVDIHFIRVGSRHKSVVPVSVPDGWPGSVLEQLKIVAELFSAELRAAFRSLR